jgi:hypothetical protein
MSCRRRGSKKPIRIAIEQQVALLRAYVATSLIGSSRNSTSSEMTVTPAPSCSAPASTPCVTRHYWLCSTSC